MSAYYNAAIYILLNYLAHSSAIFLKSNMMRPKQIYCPTLGSFKLEVGDSSAPSPVLSVNSYRIEGCNFGFGLKKSVRKALPIGWGLSATST